MVQSYMAPAQVAEEFEAYIDLGITWSAFLVLTCAERTRLHELVNASDSDIMRLERAVAKDYRKLQVSRRDWASTIKRVVPPISTYYGTSSDSEEEAPTTTKPSGAKAVSSAPVMGVVVNKELAKNFGSLKNQASTCYLNALLQALYHIPYFRDTIYEMSIEPGTSPDDSIPLALQRLFCQLQTKEANVKTVELTNAFGWTTEDAAVQHDVHEFARKLLDELDEQMNDTPQAHKIKKMFQGIQIYYTRCLDAEYTSKREQPFYDVELVVKENASLDDSLKAYTKPEQLDGKIYKWEHEDGTETLHEAERGVCFKTLPPILMFHPNRVDFCMRTFQRITVQNEWTIPLEINVADYLDPDLKVQREGETGWRRENSIAVDHDETLDYVLHSVVIHSGGATYGHYYCYVRYGDQWVKFNDESVTVETEATVMNEAIGGETTYRDSWGYTRTTARTKKASLLTYVNKKVFDKVVYEVPQGADALPEHLRHVIEEMKEKERLEEELKAAEARMVEITSVVQDPVGEYLAAMADATQRKKFKFDQDATANEMKETLSKELGVAKEQLRLWRYHSHFNNYSHSPTYAAECVDNVEGFTAFQFSPKYGRYYNYYTTMFIQVLTPQVEEEAMSRTATGASNTSHLQSSSNSATSSDSDLDEDPLLLLHVTEFDGATLNFLDTASGLVELRTRFLKDREDWKVRYYMGKELKNISRLTDLVSGDSIVIAAPEHDAGHILRAHEKAHNAIEVTLYRLNEAFLGEEVTTISLVGSLSLAETQVEVLDALRKLQQESPDEYDDLQLPESPEMLGLRNHDSNADMPHRNIAYTNKYHHLPSWRNDARYNTTLENIMTSGGYLLTRLYFQPLPAPMKELDKEHYIEVSVSLGEAKLKHVFVQVDDKPSWETLFRRIKNAAEIDDEKSIRVVKRYNDRQIEVFDMVGDATRTVRMDSTYQYYADVLPDLIEGVEEDDQTLFDVKHVSRQSGEDYYGFPTTIYYSAADTGETLMKRILAKLLVDEKHWDDCLKNWRLLVNDNYHTRQLVQLKDNVAEMVKKADAERYGFFMLDHPMPVVPKKLRYAERELTIKKKSTSPVPDAGSSTPPPKSD